jgi:hypothetical protein
MASSDHDFRFPDLRFLPVESLVPHERHDEQRMRPLVEKIRTSGVLKNPPIVAPLPPGPGGEERFVVLDGANRATAALTADIPHIVAQVVRYEEPDVRLTTWYHALGEYPRTDLEGACLAIPGLECHREDLIHARALVARREALAYVHYAGGAVTTLHGGGDLQERNRMLHGIVDTYRDRRRLYRMSTDSLEVARERYPEVTALIVFPHFEPAEVVELATSGGRMPAGITRHLIRWRALRLNVPLERMIDRQTSLADKNRWLEAWLQEKLAQRQVRFYEESTVLFDE